jgi:hypothetical protein
MQRRTKVAKVPDTQESMMKCICGSCPTYDQCMKDKMEGLFCAKGVTTCELNKQGCICATCPLTPEFGLDKLYYCETGAAE